MIFRQLLHEGLAAASYLIGCVAKGEAAVVDPSLSAETYTALAAEKGLQIVAVFETHMHADYFSTGRAIAALTGATIYAPRLADVQFPHQPIADGDVVNIGNLVIRALHTPGHTPEHTAYVVSDTPRSNEPWFVLTGDSLFVGDVARVDLVSLAGTGTDVLYASLQKIMTLADDVEVYPGHFGGSACGGRAMSGKVASTIGFERRHNWALQAPDYATFDEWMRRDVREVVEAILLHRNTNRGELPVPLGYYGQHAQGLSEQQIVTASAQGAVVIDVRTPGLFAKGYIAGAINIPYQREAMVLRLTALISAGSQVILYADTIATAEAAAEIARQAGYQVLGMSNATLTGGVRLPVMTIDDLHDAVLNGVHVLDVRDTHEHAKGIIDGAVLVPHVTLAQVAATLPAVAWYIVCESGQRATISASYLLHYGHAVAGVVTPGGMSDYNARYTPYEVGSIK
jgi:hydroxyacylglutathione hydrolase